LVEYRSHKAEVEDSSSSFGTIGVFFSLQPCNSAVECLPYKQEVVGSNPIGATNSNWEIQLILLLVAFLMKRKYTRDLLATAVRLSVSVAGVIRLLGLRQAGGTQTLVSRRILEYGLDTSHFTGKSTNRGPGHKGPITLPPDKILVKRFTGTRRPAVQLRRAMVKSGIPFSCTTCGVGSTWCNRELKLQVNHRNRDWLDDRLENLEFLCPNCHSQTEGWCNSKGGAELFSTALQGRLRRKRKSANVGMADIESLGLSALNERVGSSPSLRTRTSLVQPCKGCWPSVEELARMVMDNPVTKVARLIGVSDVAVKKRCRRLGVETRPVGYWAKLRSTKSKGL
jgi:hypothetical protein